MANKSEAGKKEEELQVVVYTPDGIKAETKARHLVVPGAEGDTMILPGHCGLVIPLRVGVLQIHHPGSVEYYSVSGGTLMVDKDNVSVSAYAAEEGRSIDRYRERKGTRGGCSCIRCRGPYNRNGEDSSLQSADTPGSTRPIKARIDLGSLCLG